MQCVCVYVCSFIFLVPSPLMCSHAVLSYCCSFTCLLLTLCPHATLAMEIYLRYASEQRTYGHCSLDADDCSCGNFGQSSMCFLAKSFFFFSLLLSSVSANALQFKSEQKLFLFPFCFLITCVSSGSLLFQMTFGPCCENVAAIVSRERALCEYFTFEFD